MKLRHKTLLIINLTLLCLIGTLYGLLSTILMGNIRSAEQRESEQTVKGVIGILTKTQESFRDRYSDWSAWDDTYQFVQDANKTYEQANLNPTVLKNLKVNLIAYVNNAGEIVYGTGFDLINAEFKPLPTKLKRPLPKTEILLQNYDPTLKITGLVLLDGNLMWISSQPILPTEGQAPILGSLIVGRYLDSQGIEELSRIARLPINIYQIDSPTLPQEVQKIRFHLSDRHPIAVKALSEQTIGGYTLLKDIYGQPILILKVEIPRTTYQQGQNSLIYLLFSLLVVGIIFAAVVELALEKEVVSRIVRFTEDVSRISRSGNLSLRLTVSGKDEIYSLGLTANEMLEALERSQEKLAQANKEIAAFNEKLQAENFRMSAELKIARQIQMMILPKPEELENIAELDIAGYMEPADEVGGDYYDVLHADGIVTLGIGDVTGHGLESGILMLMTQTAVRTLQEIREVDPIRFLDTLNRTIYKNVQRMNSDKVLSLAIINYDDGKISISGQHEEIIVVRKSGLIERIDTISLGFPIGLDEEIAEHISHAIFALHPGDGIVLYTDGISEAQDINKIQYQVERLCEVIRTNWQRSSAEIKDAIIADVRRHIGKQKVFDDITLLVLKRQEKKGLQEKY